MIVGLFLAHFHASGDEYGERKLMHAKGPMIILDVNMVSWERQAKSAASGFVCSLEQLTCAQFSERSQINPLIYMYI